MRMVDLMFKLTFKILRLVVYVGLVAMALVPQTASAASQEIHILKVDGTIVPVIADYLDRGISRAEEENAIACIIELDTPGGLLDSTEKIVQKMLNARIPIVVYVMPKGAWAASAGTFITLAGHIAVMTPGTTIGAAHPVAGGGEQIPEDQLKKITEFSAKWMGTIAQERGRNVEEAQLAVTESKSFSDTDALDNNLIDFRAESLEEVISQINGRKATVAGGTEVTIDTSGYRLVRNDMNWIEDFLLTISNPNIAYVLLSLGTIGLIAELYNPGAIFPGVIGAISLLLAFYSLGVLDANLGGILLVVLAFGLFVAEIFTSSFGILTAGGIIALILGSLLLFPGRPAVFRIDPWLIAVVTILIAGFFAFVINRVIHTHRRQVYVGQEEMVGKVATARTALNPEGMVFLEGERWAAVSEDGKVEPGEEVVVKRIDGLKLYVARKTKEGTR